MRYCFVLASIFLYSFCDAQYFTVSGKIVNSKLEPLAFVSVKVKGLVTGALSKEDGSYELKLEPGKYDLLFTMVGYTPQVIPLAITGNYKQNIILTEEEKNLAELVVTTKLKDKSIEIIKNVIRQKEELLAAPGAYSTVIYIKATQEDSGFWKARRKSNIPDSIQKKRLSEGSYSSMSMAEIVLSYDHESRTRNKEERTGVEKRGDASSLFYLSVTEGDFNLYNNLIYSRTLSTVTFLSPVSYSGLNAYKYKITSTVSSGKNKIYTISVKPRDLSNVTVEGELTIMDSTWVLLHAKYRLPLYHLPEYDFFEVDQQYDYVQQKAWMITRQEFTYFSKNGKGKLSGKTVARYGDFELNKKFPDRYFGTEVSSTVQEAYERDSLFWQQTRIEPLTAKEIKFIQYRDSVYRATHTKTYLDSIDRLTNQVTWKKMLFNGLSFYNREKERTWHIPSIPSIYMPFQFGGGRLKLGAFYSKRNTARKTINVYGDVSYGFRNKDINGALRLTRMYNPFNRAFYRVEASRSFQYIFLGDAWINMLKRNNLYLSNAFGLGHGQEILNGLSLYADVDVSVRKSLADYKTNPDFDSLVNFNNNQAIAFEPYNAFYGKVKLAYTPFQKYIREPREKIILGSKWPTVYVEWRKGIPGIMNSVVDFDYLEFGLEQELKLGTTGVSRYNIKTGSFLNRNDLRLVDYKFQRRGDPILFMNPDEAFQSLDSTFALFKRFYQAHYVHEFNGSIINRVPFLKKLQLREVGGGGFLIAPEKNLRYYEIFGGVERVFKWPFDKLQRFKLGVYIISSATNRSFDPVQFKIGITSWDRRTNKWY